MPPLPLPKEQFRFLRAVGSEVLFNPRYADKVINFIRSCERSDRISCFHEDPYFFSDLYKYFKKLTTENERSRPWKFSIKK